MPSAPPTLLGKYTAPPVRKGDRVTCLYRDADCFVTGFSASPSASHTRRMLTCASSRQL